MNHYLFGAICDLPPKKGKALLKALKEGLPLNRRLRKLLAQAEDAAENSRGIESLVESEYLELD